MRQLTTFILLLVLCAMTSLRAEEAKPTLAAAKADFAKADKALNAAYGEAKANLSEAEFAQLRDGQRRWLEWRDQMVVARIAVETGADNEKEAEAIKLTPGYFSNAGSLTSERVSWIKGLIAADDLQSLTGVWEDSFGGHLEIVEREGQLHFVISVVRGVSYNLGWIAGISTWNSPLGWFTDKGRNADKEDETNLVFICRDRQLEVAGANTEYYQGNRAYFEGRYVRVGRLDDRGKDAVLSSAKTGEMPEGN